MQSRVLSMRALACFHALVPFVLITVSLGLHLSWEYGRAYPQRRAANLVYAALGALLFCGCLAITTFCIGDRSSTKTLVQNLPSCSTIPHLSLQCLSKAFCYIMSCVLFEGTGSLCARRWLT